ncbi:MAG: S1C family serine protease [Acutalibacteraceae bacterium]|jgi:serine protease Do
MIDDEKKDEFEFNAQTENLNPEESGEGVDEQDGTTVEILQGDNDDAQKSSQPPPTREYSTTVPPAQGYYHRSQTYNPPPPPPFYNAGQNRPPSPPPGYPRTASYGQKPPAPVSMHNKGASGGRKIFYSILAVVLVFCLIGSAFAIGQRTGRNHSGNVYSESTTVGDGPSVQINETPTAHQQVSSSDVLTPVQVAEKVKPSVIGILVYSKQSNFGQSQGKAGEGSGIIMGVDEANQYTYILTCAHVISDKNAEIYVQLDDTTQHKAELIGYDIRTDIGVVKIKKTGLKVAEFGNSETLKVGEQVFAVGNPGGAEFYGSFTAGMVSAIDRPVNSEIGYTMELIQHDAAINPGNSGGALVNVYGQVIGINSLKIIHSNYEGMGFAIPMNSAKTIVDAIIKHGYVPNRPKLGITYMAANENSTYSMIVSIKGLPAGSLYINEISPDSDLVNTNAKKGDLIIAVNGKDLKTADVLLELIDKGKVGDSLELTLCRIARDYKITEFKVRVKLVEDRGTKAPNVQEETTTDLYDYFYPPFG